MGLCMRVCLRNIYAGYKWEFGSTVYWWIVRWLRASSPGFGASDIDGVVRLRCLFDDLECRISIVRSVVLLSYRNTLQFFQVPINDLHQLLDCRKLSTSIRLLLTSCILYLSLFYEAISMVSNGTNTIWKPLEHMLSTGYLRWHHCLFDPSISSLQNLAIVLSLLTRMERLHWWVWRLVE